MTMPVAGVAVSRNGEAQKFKIIEKAFYFLLSFSTRDLNLGNKKFYKKLFHFLLQLDYECKGNNPRVHGSLS